MRHRLNQTHDSGVAAGLRVLWRRALAFAVDYVAIAEYLLVMTATMAIVSLAFPGVRRALFGTPERGELSGFLLVTLPVTLYFALGESGPSQATWGKRRLGLKVVDRQFGRVSRARALARTVLKFVPWELAHACIWRLSFDPQSPSPLVYLGLATVWVLVGLNIVSLVLSPQRQTIYDKLSGTRVVEVR